MTGHWRKKEDDDGPNVERMSFEDKEDDGLMSQSRPAVSAILPANLSKSLHKVDESGPISILAYCVSSISMTVVNKYVVSGDFWNLTFFYLAVQVRCIRYVLLGAFIFYFFFRFPFFFFYHC